jgi:hypothetical protein
LCAKAKKNFGFVGRLERNVMEKIRRMNGPKSKPIEETFQLDGAVVKVAYPSVTIENEQQHCEAANPNQVILIFCVF